MADLAIVVLWADCPVEGKWMQRLYKRVNKKFIPCAWMCPDCGQIKND